METISDNTSGIKGTIREDLEGSLKNLQQKNIKKVKPNPFLKNGGKTQKIK